MSSKRKIQLVRLGDAKRLTQGQPFGNHVEISGLKYQG